MRPGWASTSVLVHRVEVVGAGGWRGGAGRARRVVPAARSFDIVVLSLACLAGIALVVSALGRLLAEGHGDFGIFLLLGLVTVGLAAAAAAWLLRAWRDANGSPA